MRLVLCVLALAASATLAAPAWAAAPVTPPAQSRLAAARPAWSDFQADVTDAKAAMMGSPEAALVAARRAQSLAQSHPPSIDRELALATAGWLQGEALIRINQPAAAVPVINAALARAHAVAPGAKLEGDLLKARGSAAAAQSRMQSALADFQAAYRVYAQAGQPRGQALVLQDIGGIYSDARDYPHSVKYFLQSLEIFKADPALNLTVRNNLGSTYLGMKRDADALSEFQQALQMSRQIGSRLMEVRVLSNVALAQTRLGRFPAADAALTEAQRLASSDPSARASEGYVWDARAQLEARRGRMADAAAALDHVFAGQDLTRTDARFADAHANAAQVYAALHEPQRALAHLAAYKRLDDQARDVAASTNAALMGAEFDFANQNLKIERLRSEKLQRDIALQRSRARAQTQLLWTVVGAGGAVFAMGLVVLIGMRRSRDAVRSANRRLESTNTALERALKAKSQFLATTSHEIRTPLNGVLGMTQVLLADRSLTPAVRGRVELVHGAGETMRALVDDILDLAKMETGRITVEKRPMDLGRLLDEAVRLWRAEAQTKGLALILDAQEAPRWIVEDEARLRQVLFNLLANATKFTDAGEVALRVRTRGERLTFCVCDTGIGIAPRDAERVFEPFTQIDGGTTRRHGGTGLGLAICRDVARALGGDVTLQSQLGEGATFTLDVPLELAHDHAVAAREEAGWPASLAEARILVIEPNPLARAVLRTVTAAAAREVEAVADLAAAHDRLAVGGFHHVLAAGEALGADAAAGQATCRALVQAAAPARTTLLLTAAEPDAAAALLGAGADRILARPVAAETLTAALRQALASEAAAAPPPAAIAA